MYHAQSICQEVKQISIDVKVLISYRTFSDHHEIKRKCNKNKTLKLYFIYLFYFSAVLGLPCNTWLLIAVASLVEEHGLQTLGFSGCGTQAQYLQLGSRVGSVAVSRELSLLCETWDCPRPVLGPVYPALADEFFTTEPPGKPLVSFYLSIFIKTFLTETFYNLT